MNDLSEPDKNDVGKEPSSNAALPPSTSSTGRGPLHEQNFRPDADDPPKTYARYRPPPPPIVTCNDGGADVPPSSVDAENDRCRSRTSSVVGGSTIIYQDLTLLADAKRLSRPRGGRRGGRNVDSWHPPRTPGRLARILASRLPPLHEPRYHHAATMFSCLVLTSGLALMSGLDAYLRCGSSESSVYFSEWTDDDFVAVEEAAGSDYDGAAADEADGANDADGDDGMDNRYRYMDRWRWLEEEDGQEEEEEAQNDVEDEFGDADDNYTSFNEAESCDETFKEVLVPATAVGIIVGVIAMSIILFANPRTKTKTIKGSLSPPTDVTTADESPQASALRRLQVRRQHLYQCIQQWLLSCFALAAWLYGLVFLLMEPRTGYNDNYKSLAAIDGWGRVGDNANLYYSTWTSLGLSFALVYELSGMSLLQWRRMRQAAAEASRIVNARHHCAADGRSGLRSSLCPTPCSWIDRNASKDSYFETESTKAIETVLDWSTAQVEEAIRESRTTWYNSLYKLRARTGIWVSTLIASSIICISSGRMWKNIVVPAAEALRGRSYYDWYGSTEVCDVFYVFDDVVEENDEADGDEGNAEKSDIDGSGWTPYEINGVTYDTCTRTELAGTAGLVVSILSVVAIISHSFLRRHAAAVAASADPSQHSIHDRTPTPCGSIFALPMELGLSMLNSLVLGSSSIFVTGCAGPAQSVGNLYYSMWLAFILSMRITVACLEQLFSVDDEEELMRERANPAPPGIMACGVATTIEVDGMDPSMRFQVPEYEDSLNKKEVITKIDNDPYGDVMPTGSIFESDDSFEDNEGPSDDLGLNRNERPKRLRRWGSLAIFSSICAASTWDAANDEKGGITTAQQYMFVLPLAVASLCYIIFFMCLSDIAYIFVDDFRVGGIVAIVTFLAWLGNIVVTMHAKTSFAVNGIGEIKFANLYYFSWASIIVAGLQMKTYVTKQLGVKPKSLVLVMWFLIVKVSFVMFGAGMHIWLNIADTCVANYSDWTSRPFSFCNRTKFSMIVGITGTVTAYAIIFLRFIRRKVTRWQLCFEMTLSGLFVFIFLVAAVVVTSIGGPGDSVGDLYYATWFSFLASIGVCISCYDELLKDNHFRSKRSSKSVNIEIPGETITESSSSPSTYRKMDD